MGAHTKPEIPHCFCIDDCVHAESDDDERERVVVRPEIDPLCALGRVGGRPDTAEAREQAEAFARRVKKEGLLALALKSAQRALDLWCHRLRCNALAACFDRLCITSGVSHRATLSLAFVVPSGQDSLRK